jgi:hypothetical protein
MENDKIDYETFEFPDSIISEEELKKEYWSYLDIHNLDDLIKRSFKKKCFIESLSLLHNYIEYILINKIKNFFYKLFKLNNEGFEQGNYFENIGKNLTEKEIECRNLIKNILLNNRGQFKYLSDFIFFAKQMSIMDNKYIERINLFNINRNRFIHKILIKKIESFSPSLIDDTKPCDQPHKKYSNLIPICKEGYKLILDFENRTENIDELFITNDEEEYLFD